MTVSEIPLCNESATIIVTVWHVIVTVHHVVGVPCQVHSAIIMPRSAHAQSGGLCAVCLSVRVLLR